MQVSHHACTHSLECAGGWLTQSGTACITLAFASRHCSLAWPRLSKVAVHAAGCYCLAQLGQSHHNANVNWWCCGTTWPILHSVLVLRFANGCYELALLGLPIDLTHMYADVHCNLAW